MPRSTTTRDVRSLRLRATARRWSARFCLAAAIVAVCVGRSVAIENAIPWIGGDASRAILGPGTGVVIGVVDSGVAADHPFLAGNDSLGQPRLVAAANFVTSEPANLGEDVFGHGTAVAGVALAAGEIDGVRYDGLAPDARYVNARVLDAGNQLFGNDRLINGIQFALAHQADMINLSIAMFDPQSDGNTQVDLLIDYLVDARNVLVTTAAGNKGNAEPPHAIGAARNGLTLGALNADYSRVAAFSSAGPTSDLRFKPDLVAPGQAITTLEAEWAAGPLVSDWSGTSFAAPQAAGLAAQLIGYGRANGLDTDARVLRAVIINGAAKTLDSDGTAWSTTVSRPLDNQQGSGRIDALATAQQYVAGEFGLGPIGPAGWALDDVTGLDPVLATPNVYTFSSDLPAGTYLDATLVFNRHVQRVDFGTPGVIDPLDFFYIDFTNDRQDDLNLFLFRDGQQVAASRSGANTVEHIHFQVTDAGRYDLRVVRRSGVDLGERYALAWRTYAVPEPGGLPLVAGGLLVVLAARVGRQALRIR